MQLKIISPRILFKRFLHKYNCKMDKAYFRQLPETDQFELSFQCKNFDNLKLNRQFNFCRKLSEPVSECTRRISLNVEKVLNKKNKKKVEENVVVDVSLEVDDKVVPGDSLCREVFLPNNNIVLKLLGSSYFVVVNSPWIDSLALPNVAMASFLVYPSKFDSVFTDISFSEFMWSVSNNNKNWAIVGCQFSYAPKTSEIGSYLKFSCTPKNSEAEGPLTEVESNEVIQPGPGPCPFETRHKFTSKNTEGNVFRIVTYNILADLYCDSEFTRLELFPYCPAYALAGEYRKQLLLKEILGYNADIICLQEVDKKMYNHDLYLIFSQMGYETDFVMKGANVPEGVACLYRKNRFTKLESFKLNLSEDTKDDPLYSDIWEKISQNENLLERITERNNVVQVNVLESNDTKNVLIVANTHFYFHPNADHIRLIHGGLAIRFIEDLVQKFKQKFKEKVVSPIFCGDFNSVPECGVYKLFTTGHVPPFFQDFRSCPEETIDGLELEQTLKLDSACGTPKYTNFTAGFADCLDYIYYDTTSLKVNQVIPLPSHEELTQFTALPSIVFPSDHVALISDLTWIT